MRSTNENNSLSPSAVRSALPSRSTGRSESTYWAPLIKYIYIKYIILNCSKRLMYKFISYTLK